MTIDAVVERNVERVSEGGNLLANLALIDINTWQTSQEVWRDWQNNTNVQGAPTEGVYTANLAVYKIENDEVVFDLFGREGNPFMNETLRKDAYNSILQNEFFFPKGAMKQYIKSAKPLVTVRYSRLRLKTNDCGDSYCYIEFDGNNNDEEKRLFKGVCGTDNIDNGKQVYLLRSNVVETQLRNRKDDFIARACYFCDCYDLHFLALYWRVDLCDGAIRGIRLEKVAENDA